MSAESFSRLAIALVAMVVCSPVVCSEDAVDAFLARCSPGMTKGQVDRLVAEIGGGRWASLSNTLKFDGELTADLVEVTPWDHLELIYQPVGDRSGNGNLTVGDPLVRVERHRFAELLEGMPADQSELLTAVQAVGTVSGYRFDPAALIACANRLRRAGEATAVDVLQRYLRLVPIANPAGAPDAGHREWAFDLDGQRVILIARLLYGDGVALPRPLLGAPEPDLPDALTPLFPLLVEDDVPFLGMNGYSLDGLAEPPSAHLDRCRAAGRFRQVDLVPARTPVAVLDTLTASPGWSALTAGDPVVAKELRDLLRCQAIRSLRPVLPRLDPDAYLSASCCGGEEQAAAAWTRIEATVIVAGVHWDPEQQRYVATTTAGVP